jgi:hypothetical protein
MMHAVIQGSLRYGYQVAKRRSEAARDDGLVELGAADVGR